MKLRAAHPFISPLSQTLLISVYQLGIALGASEPLGIHESEHGNALLLRRRHRRVGRCNRQRFIPLAFAFSRVIRDSQSSSTAQTIILRRKL